jgi:acetyl esterase
VHYYVDPELAGPASASPATDVSDVPAARARMATARSALPQFKPPATVQRDVLSAGSGNSAPPVPVWLFRPARSGDAPLPVLVYFHGGGFVLGDAVGDQSIACQLAVSAQAAVASVDYRLAPEFPYPAAVDDGYQVLTWLERQGSEFGLRGDRIGVCGSSAGAAIAAALCLRARDLGGPALACQILEIPVLDDRAETLSAQAGDTPTWNRQSMADSWRHYLSGLEPGENVPAYAAPARAADLSGLPPAYVCVSSADPLRDEGIGYAQRLVEAGVATELRMFPGTFHGSTSMFPDTAISRRARAALLEAAARLLSGSPDRTLAASGQENVKPL